MDSYSRRGKWIRAPAAGRSLRTPGPSNTASLNARRTTTGPDRHHNPRAGPVKADHLPRPRTWHPLTSLPRRAILDLVTYQLRLVTRAHIDLGFVWSASCSS
ncbi:hypothetical protein GCM10010470_04670 [Saccharopolyspora taberi]|uniref:Uncharacterized protein n=1 Tax=Saccharopolyspora taberi TaxID=60895 RepID=A0ABN3V236_9PSEU